jgi:hypothetical protein
MRQRKVSLPSHLMGEIRRLHLALASLLTNLGAAEVFGSRPSAKSAAASAAP